MKKYSIYIDESGSPSLTDVNEKFILLTGLVIEGDKDFELSSYFEFLKRKYNIFSGRHFHSYDIFEDRRSPVFLPAEKARELSRTLTEFFRVAPIQLYVAYLNKAQLKRRLGIPIRLDSSSLKNTLSKDSLAKEVRDVPYDILLSRILFWFRANVLTTRDARGSIIAESRQESDLSFLRAYLQAKNTALYLGQKQMQRHAELMKHKTTGIRFETKIGEVAGLELADLISYLSFQYLKGRLHKFRARGVPQLWKSVRKVMHEKKIHQVKGGKLLSLLPNGRAHKMSQFAKDNF